METIPTATSEEFPQFIATLIERAEKFLPIFITSFSDEHIMFYYIGDGKEPWMNRMRIGTLVKLLGKFSKANYVRMDKNARIFSR